MGSVNILKASAGSGKTYQLAYNYVRSVIEHPWLYRHILAVTFTNKATEEMKSRILSEINTLASGSGSPYIAMLKSDLGLSAEQIGIRATDARTKILHDYGRFNVVTIDKFFQRIIRSFLKELGIDLSFSVELHTDSILEQAADRLIDDIKDDVELREAIMQFVDDKIDQNKKWDVRSEITAMGSEIFKERYKKAVKGHLSPEQQAGIINSEIARNKKTVTQMKELAEAALAIIADQGLTISDFAYGANGFASYFVKMAAGRIDAYGKRVTDALESEQKWYNKTSPRRREIIALIPTLQPMLRQLCELYDDNIFAINTTTLVQENFRSFALLEKLAQKVAEVCLEQNIVPIAETSGIIGKLVGGNDTSFIYEKSGNALSRFLIDEFQDTSLQQWENFVPLLDNALSQSDGSPVLLVGDVKQSIYRWRGGDWQILGRMVAEQFVDTTVTNLDTNYRSDGVVVNFNNNLIDSCVSIDNEQLNAILDGGFAKLKDMAATAYDGHRQKSAKAEDVGYVRITQTKKRVEVAEGGGAEGAFGAFGAGAVGDGGGAWGGGSAGGSGDSCGGRIEDGVRIAGGDGSAGGGKGAWGCRIEDGVRIAGSDGIAGGGDITGGGEGTNCGGSANSICCAGVAEDADCDNTTNPTNPTNTKPAEIARHAAKQPTYSQGSLFDIGPESEQQPDSKSKSKYKIDPSKELIISEIEELQSRGYSPSDIAILVRKNSEGVAIASTLLDYKAANPHSPYSYEIVTQEALKIGSSDAVNFIVAIFSLSVSAKNAIRRAIYNRYLGFDIGVELSSDEARFVESLRLVSLEEAFEEVVMRYELSSSLNEIAYIQAFQNLVHDFATSKVADIPLFLKWWTDKGAAMSINMPSSAEAITIITIHKAKGLQYKAVIIPDCSWALQPRSGSLHWARSSAAPIDALGKVPLRWKNLMAASYFSPEYVEEVVMSHIDNLNTFYVAVTRAQEELHLILPQGQKPSSTVAGLVEQSLSASGDRAQVGNIYGRVCENDYGKIFEFGIPRTKEPKKAARQEVVSFPTSRSDAKLRYGTASARYFEGVDSPNLSPRNYGILMHRVFENIVDSSQVKPQLEAMLVNGMISQQEMARVEQMIGKSLEDPLIGSWYSPDWDVVRNESAIIIPRQKQIRRPDRVIAKGTHAVVVDYKFGTLKRDVHRKQIAEYIELLKGMGYRRVDGYIWYVEQGEVEGVFDSGKDN